jgi:hypothetical protein
MERENVNSSNLESIGYDSENEILEVEFKHGGVYQYFDVSESVFNELMNAPSHGVYFSANIRNDYEFSKL